MITAQDIREKTFEKARVNGYDMAEVDDFLEELADDITNTQKENAVLKSKMKVLVEKIEEYRSNEEALNKAVISAQKLAVQIEAEARTRSSAMLQEADEQVKAKLGTIPEQIAEAEDKLNAAKDAYAKYSSELRNLIKGQLASLDKLDGVEAEEEPAEEEESYVDAVEETVKSIDRSVSLHKPEPEFKIDLSDEIAEVGNNSRRRSFDSTQPFNL